MSIRTENEMMSAILAHFADEGVPCGYVHGVKVRLIVDDQAQGVTHGAVYYSDDDYFTRVALDAPTTNGVHDDMAVRNYTGG